MIERQKLLGLAKCLCLAITATIVIAGIAKAQPPAEAKDKPIADVPKPTENEDQAQPQLRIPEKSESPRIQAVVKAFANPKGATRLFPDARLWVDKKKRQIVIDGYVAKKEGPLEMFACPSGTKEHESVVALLTKSQYVHAALLAISATPGTPVDFDPVYQPPTGDRIAIWVLWRDEDGGRHRMKAQQWIRRQGTQEQLDVDFVFAGSGWWRDPISGHDLYTADDGDLVCVSNFTSATLDIPIESSKANSALEFVAFTKNIPQQFTPVRMVMKPIDPPVNQRKDAKKDAAAEGDKNAKGAENKEASPAKAADSASESSTADASAENDTASSQDAGN